MLSTEIQANPASNVSVGFTRRDTPHSFGLAHETPPPEASASADGQLPRS